MGQEDTDARLAEVESRLEQLTQQVEELVQQRKQDQAKKNRSAQRAKLIQGNP